MRESPFAGPDGRDPLWSLALDALQRSLPPRTIRQIASQSQPLCRSPGELSISVVDGALEDWVGEGWITLLIEVLHQLSGRACSLAILPASAQTLEDFADSPENHRARMRAEEIATSPARVPGITVFHGPPGCGKTHLLRAIQRRRASGPPASPILARDARALSLELLGSLQGDRPAPFHAELREARALLLDGGEALRQRSLLQDELLAALELLERRRCPIVLGARSDILEDDCLHPPLRDRIRKSQLFRLHGSTGPARFGIVSRRLGAWGLGDPEEAAARIVTSLSPDLRSLDRLITSALARCRSIADLRRCELPSAGQPPQARRAPLDPRSVLQVVCRHFNLRPAELRTSSRSPRLTVPRQISMYLLRRHADLSYPEIGQRFHRHHTTGIHAYRRISSERQKNSDLRATLDLLEKELLCLPDDGARG